jgi:hydrogenase expression/formation protein HypE
MQMRNKTQQYEEILLAHGSGGRLTHDLITSKFLPHLGNSLLDVLGDSAVFDLGNKRLCFTTDSYVISPIFFPGGNIGSLSVHGTVNDIAVSGGRPLFMSAGFILEEGFGMDDLEAIIKSMANAAREAGVKIVTGDTKVVSKGSADKIFINTSGVGVIEYEGEISMERIAPGDLVIINGTIGDHGAAVMSTREGIGFSPNLTSDCASLNGLIEGILRLTPNIHFMRDATRGGLGAVLVEAAQGSGARIEINERDIPVKEEVRGLCEILGLDPLTIANEGKVVVFCPGSDADRVLTFMKGHVHGRDSAVIGTVTGSGEKRVILNTVVGGSRQIDMPVGELIPRIC